MAGNPLVAAAEPAPAPKPERPAQVVHLVCNHEPKQVKGLDEFLSVFNGKDSMAEVVHFRYAIQRKVRRAMGGKFSKGLTTEVTENVEINLNQDLFGLRRWLGNIRNDPSNVLLLNASKVKEEALAAPLLFSELIRTGRPILVTGLDASSRDQLMAQVDLKFAEIPPQVERNYALKTTLLARAQRKKGFSSSMRNLMDLDFIPKELQDKIHQIAMGGDPSAFTDAEVVNLSLLADLVSRYEAVLAQFKEFVAKSSLQVPQLIACFELIMSDTSTELLMESFKELLKDAVEDGTQITTKNQLFGHLYRFLTGTGDEARRTADRQGVFFRVLTNTFVRRRSQIDPLLWKRCHMLNAANPHDESTLKLLRPYLDNLDKWVQAGTDGAAEEISRQTGQHIYTLAALANQDPGVMREEKEFARHRMANHLLPLLRTESFNTEKLTYPSPVAQALPKDVNQFVQEYAKRPITDSDLKQIRNALAPVLRTNEIASQVLQKSVIEVMLRYARDREQILREIYILNAVGALVKYPFHLGEHALNSLERRCCGSVLESRMGLEVHPHAVSEFSVGLFESKDEPPLGRLKNDPATLCRAYAMLTGLRVETVVKRAVDHKINYFIKTYGEKFFEVIYERVVRRNDIPLSQGQLAHMLKERNVLGSLDDKGLRPEAINDMEDPFLVIGMRRAEGKKIVELPHMLEDFQTEYADSLNQFRALLNELKTSAEADDRDENPKRLIWTFYRQGIYNLAQESARLVFRKTIFYRHLQELIAKISSENYSVFHKEGTADGLQIFVPRSHAHLLTIGDRFSFLDANEVVKYRLLPSPEDDPAKLDEISRTFIESLDGFYAAEEKEQWVLNLEALNEQLVRCHQIWSRFSRNLCLAVLDRVISETIIKQLIPDKFEPKNLYFLPDAVKLCLGKATVGEESVPFTKVLQRPELIGNIFKNPRTASTTIDDFAIEVHKISRVWEELRSYAGIIDDIQDIIEGMSHDRSEMAPAVNYQKHLAAILKILDKPMREISEHAIQALHTHAKNAKDALQILYNSPASSKRKLLNRLQAELEERRSDREHTKLNFTDSFILDKQEVRVKQMVERDGERVAITRKKEVELEATHQTLPLRVRQVIKVQEFINRKKYIVFSLEGQKKKQTDYVLEAIDTLLTMRGNGVNLYVDTSMMDESQVHRLATRVKPHNFFNMNDISPEAPPGMKVNITIDPLSGKAIKIAEQDSPGGEDGAAAAAPKVQTDIRSANDPNVRYRFDPEDKAFYFQNEEGEIKANVFKVDIGKSIRTVILMVKVPGGRPLFHGLLGNELLFPTGQAQPPTICSFQFIDKTVSIVNEGGKPTVKVEQESGGFLDELRDVD
ncbi:MAG: hypothetical protein O7D96_01030 [SAR324 cluster bacterium]|nr:hypothetical protein [SAR324 cluster bacterium]